MKNIFIFLVLGLFLISFISADVSIGTIRQGSSIQLTQTCSNCTYVNLTSVLNPTNNYILLGQYSMTKNGSNFNYTFVNTTLQGNYVYTTCGDLNGINTCQSVNFEVTNSGKEFSTATSIIQFALLFLIVIIFIGGAIGINFLPNRNQQDEEGKLMSISWLKYLRGTLWFVEYILFVGILFMASNLAYAFLPDEMFADILFAIYQMAFRLAPVIVIVWIAWIFVKIFQDKKLWGLMQRGIFPQGNL